MEDGLSFFAVLARRISDAILPRKGIDRRLQEDWARDA